MSARLCELDALKGNYEHARSVLESARATGDLAAIDQASLGFQAAESAYHDALYARAPGMSGDDRTTAAEALKAQHARLYEAQRREEVALERMDDPKVEFTAEVVEEYEAARQAREDLGLPDPEYPWIIDLDAEQRERETSRGREIGGYER